MSSFGTFLTNGPFHRHRGKVNLQQRFIRESKKDYPKAIRPKVNVNVNPVVDYMMSNKQKQKQETSVQTTMKYKNCSQIVPTVGLTNLIFYDCHRKRAPEPSIDDSISRLTTTSSSLATEDRDESLGRPFFAPEVITESRRNSPEIMGNVNNVFNTTPQAWINGNFADFPQPFSNMTALDFTLTCNGRSNFLSSDVNSYASFEMDLNRPTYDKNIINDEPQSDTLSFGLNLDDRSSQLYQDTIHLPDDPFEINFNSQTIENISNFMDNDSPTVTGFCTQLNATDWDMKSVVSDHTADESMAKFCVSTCSNISLELSNEGDSYADFVPLHTSTPISRRKTQSRNNAINELSELSGLLDLTDEEIFLNQREQTHEPTASFSFLGKKNNLFVKSTFNHLALLDEV